MKPRHLVILIIFTFISNCFITFNYVETSKADVLPKFYVDDDYDSSTPGWQVDHFALIQDAIDESSEGDRILVYEGDYSETITISRQLDLFGEDRDLVNIIGGNTGNRITISATNVNISHFTIKNCGVGATNAVIVINSGNAIITDNEISYGDKHGIYINNCENNIIYDNTIKSNEGNGIYFNHSNSNSIIYNGITSNKNNGIFLYNSSNNTIQYNSAINSNSYNGIFLNETSDDNIISDNTLSSNSDNGIFLNDHCNRNTISDNEIFSNSNSGIRLENSSSTTVNDCVIDDNDDYGILLVGSDSTIQSNTISDNGDHGIYLFGDDNNIILSNAISSNTYDGIRLSNSTNDSIYNNEIYDNSRYGINLDYFTMKNLIYNNYFHDNTDNAMDKSLSHNTWNITQTSGTNKVGGSYKSGNYWDDFDEDSENVTDSNGDGISNNAYTIYASNKDYGPILDVIPPTVSTPSVSPSTQSVGSYTYISVTVTDYIEVKQVYLVVTNPNSQTTNFSILQNKTGDTYYCSKKYTVVGAYSFYIAAKDPRNWQISNSGSFNIDQGTAPAITDNTAATAEPSKLFAFNATIVDDTDSGSNLTVKVSWKHGDNGGNHSMINNYGNYFEINGLLDNKTDQVSYKIFACDQWGNSRTTAQSTVSIVDTKSPDISIDTYGSTSNVIPNSYTFGATITDNHEVDNVNIEYWYENTDHITVPMDRESRTYYEKVIIIEENPSRVYIIIYASDPSGNINDTKNPFTDIGGPYTGMVGIPPEFDASNSFDLDGNLTDYSWDFGDGTTGSGETTIHTYTSNGNYTITLTITDDDGNKDSAMTYANINNLVQHKTSLYTMIEIEDNYDITLIDLFYCYDTDGDEIWDTFFDPNDVLIPIHTGEINLSGNVAFLLSIDDEDIPEFIWNSTTDEILHINKSIEGIVTDNNIHIDNNKVTTTVSVNKTEGWIYIGISKPEIGEYGEVTGIISVQKDGAEVNQDMIFEKDDMYYILDDPEIEYKFIFAFDPPPLSPPEFIPAEGTIDKDNPTIKIVFNKEVEITYADFYNRETKNTLYIISDIGTSDNIVFFYTPPNDLESGEYEILIKAQSTTSAAETENSSIYSFVSYKVTLEGIDFFQLILLLSIMGAVGAAILLLIKFKLIPFESSLYIKNKKVIPFFKPLIIGPLRIDVNDEKVKKAEFYLNGKLKDTLTQAPFVWDWNESSFMKKTIETKIYDDEGNCSSSGEMTFFIINSPRFFK